MVRKSLDMNAKAAKIVLLILFSTILLLNISCDLFKSDSEGKLTGQVILPDSFEGGVSNVYLYIEEKPGFLQVTAPGEQFVIRGVEEMEAFTLYASSVRMGVIRGETEASESLTSSTVMAVRLTNLNVHKGEELKLGSVLLKPTGSIQGKAQLYGMEEHSGIQLYIPGTSFSAETDTDGNFSISHVPQGLYTLYGEKANWKVKKVENVLLENKESDLTSPLREISDPITLYRGSCSIAGRVSLQGKSENFSGIQVSLKQIGEEETVYSVHTDSDGTYRFDHLADGTYEIILEYRGYFTRKISGIETSVGETVLVDKLQLESDGGTIRGSVELNGAESHEGIDILAEHETSGQKYNTSTNTEGEYLLDNCQPGIYVITASKTAYASGRITDVSVISSEISTADFPALLPFGSLSGRVVLEGSSNYSGVSIIAESTADPTKRYTTVSTEDGRYSLSSIPQGDYSVILQKDGYISNPNIPVQVKYGDTSLVDDVTLDSIFCTVTGSVVLDGEADSSGISILLKSWDPEGPSYTTDTDKNGEFLFHRIESGEYQLLASRNGYASETVDLIRLEQGSETQIDSELILEIAGQSAAGTALLEGETDHQGILVTATSLSDSSQVYSAISNSSGQYTLNGMETGQYRVALSSQGYLTVTLSTIEITSSDSVTLETRELPIALGTVSGIVTLEGRSDHSGIEIDLLGTAYSTLAAADGTYSFDAAPGNYSGGLRFSKADFQTADSSGTITVVTGDTYTVQSQELTALRTGVRGAVDLLGEDDNSGISVSIDELDDYSTHTDADGNYQFAPVPLGSYTLRFELAQTPTVTTRVSVIPSPMIEVPQITMIPNSSGLEGYIKLTGETDHSGIDISITNSGGQEAGEEETLETVTDASGFFELGNILSTGTHTFTAGKTGWDELSFTIDDFEPLEVREIGLAPDPEIRLTDSIPPEITEVSINDGANMSDDRNLKISITAEEFGSGIDRMQVSFDGDFDVEPWEPYQPVFTREVPVSGDGERRVWIKLRDKAGNVSTAESDSITMTGQYRIYKSELEDDELHWKVSHDIAKIEEDILIPEGKTLTIDPGVEIHVDPEKTIEVDGEIHIVGTAENPILFRALGETENDYWSGIHLNSKSSTLFMQNRYFYSSESSGNIIQHAILENVNKAISGTGSIFVDQCRIQGNYAYHQDGFAYGGGKVIFSNSEISGDIDADLYGIELILVNNRFNIAQSNNSNLAFYNTSGEAMTISYNTFASTGIHFSGTDVQFTHNIFKDTTGGISVQNWNTDAEVFLQQNSISDVWDSDFLAVETARDTITSYNFADNFWGYDKTQELDSIGSDRDAGFIHDYFDAFSLSKVIYSPYLNEAPPSAGYQADGFVDFDAVINNGAAETLEKNISVDLDLYTRNKGTGEEMRIAQTASGLLSSEWQDYESSFSYEFDESAVRNGRVNLYLQARDSRGLESGIEQCSIAYDEPMIVDVNLKSGTVVTGNDPLILDFSFEETGLFGRGAWYLDGIKQFSSSSPEYFREPSNTPEEFTLDIAGMSDGEHTIRIEIIDSEGNVGEEIISFTVDKGTAPPPDYGEGISWTEQGSLLKDTDSIYLWHFDNGSGEEVSAGPSVSVSQSSVRGLGSGSAEAETSGNIPLDLDSGKFSLEYWAHIPEGEILTIRKKDVFSMKLDYESGNPDYSHISSGIYYRRNDAFKGYDGGRVFIPEIIGSWHHYALTYDEKRIRVYFDGKLADSISVEGIHPLWQNDEYLSIISGNEVFIDELRFSDRPRSGDELKTYYQAAQPFLDR